MNISLKHIYFLYLALGLLFLPFYQYQINPDGVSLIGIAQKYLAGNFSDAVNGYWGMLYPLLLSPFLSLPVPTLIAVKLMSLLLGLILIIVFGSLIDLYQVNARVRILIIAAVAPIALYFAYSVITSDLLLTIILLLYFRVLFDPKYNQNIKAVLLCGLLGGLAYLIKQYALPFFIIHFIFINLIYYLTKRVNFRNLAINMGLGLAAFSLIVGLWSVVLSNKYGYFTFGTSGQFNMALNGQSGSGQSPFDQNILIPPPNPSAVGIWEDPGVLKIQPQKTPLSLADIKYQFFIFRENLARIALFLEIFSILSLWIITQSAFSLIFSSKTLSSRQSLLTALTLTSMLVYTLGYSLLAVVERYLWLDFLLILLLGAIQLDVLPKSFKSKQVLQKIFTFGYILTFTISALFGLIKNLNIDKDYYRKAQIIKNTLGITNANIASNVNSPPTLLLAFHSQNRYFGQTGDYQDTLGLIKLLRQNHINYYLAWQTDTQNTQLEKVLPEISDGKLSGIKIYSLTYPIN